MRVYEVKNGTCTVTVEARNMKEAVLTAAVELGIYDGVFEVNCVDEMNLGNY